MKTFERFRAEAQWDEKWNEYAVGAFPLLIWCAANGEKITYEELNRYLLKEGFSEINYKGSSKRFMGHPAGLVGEYMLDQGLPIINSLLVQAGTGIPGSGAEHFIGQHLNASELRRYNRLTASQKKKFLSDYIWSEIHAHDWSPVIRANRLDLTKFSKSDFALKKPVKKKNDKSLKGNLGKYKKQIGKRNFDGESAEHLKLKDLVLKNIDEIATLKKFRFTRKDGSKEYLLPSADRIDLLFKNSRGVVGVEVKSIRSDDADLYRGIYQCIKYKYLIQAELLEDGKYPQAECILITQRPLPPELKELASRFNVKTYVLKG